MLTSNIFQNLTYWKNKINLSSFRRNLSVSSIVQLDAQPPNKKVVEYCEYERKIANRLGYADVSRTYFYRDALGNYSLKSTTPLAQFMYWAGTVNLLIKLAFLVFLVAGYFGPLEFLDQIAALDYILCAFIAFNGMYIFMFRYPLHGKSIFDTLRKNVYKPFKLISVFFCRSYS